ncbi:tachylectin-related carbohydrate-binding protein [Nocardia amikacinitolerans]|uniref:tachylectin-related carbohydrate-binding protein n=1 Tax=Nocardia amikacinitolerans TaxID=756689 RepID=UPI0020A313A1|nr:tachylectin-related carbohydrate-binding protein [Nocardia amikacinitolerans]MCP2275707.1 Tachylectin [Nocardia amikacinitolerans]
MSDIGQIFYWVKPDGRLQWARHDGVSDGTNAWTGLGGGVTVGSGWDAYSSVFCGGAQGIIYAVTPAGDLHWYSHEGFEDGTATWTAGDGGRLVGSGWNAYAQVFAGGTRVVAGQPNGFVIYGITPEGDLYWHRHDGWTDGSPSWTGGAGGRRVGAGWGVYPKVFSIGRGVIYGITADGEMDWYRHDGWIDGSPTWTASAGGRRVDSGWDAYRRVFGSYDGSGQIYGIDENDDLEWYRHDGWQTGEPSWTAGGGGGKVGGGFRDAVFPGAMIGPS